MFILALFLKSWEPKFQCKNDTVNVHLDQIQKKRIYNWSSTLEEKGYFKIEDCLSDEDIMKYYIKLNILEVKLK